jgi:predicted secreted hydrolase
MSPGRWSIIAGTLASLLGGCPTCPDPLYELTTLRPEVRLPLDESPHCFGGGEWWYYSGRLTADTGAAFGIEAAIFHVPQLPLALPAELWAAHYAVTDVQAGEFHYDQGVAGGPHGSALTPGKGFNLSTALIHMQGGDGRDVLAAAFADGDYALNLALEDTREPVLHGGDGYVPYDTNGWSFYYSRPRMDARGTLRIGDATLAVSGQLWFDRQWGDDLDNPAQPWDWFSIRLDDGTDIMLYVYPGHDGRVAFGTVVPPSDPPYPLTADEFRVSPSATWVSPTTGIEYEVGWDIELPGQDIVLLLAAILDDAELDTRATTENVYWEGLCTVAGRIGNQPINGCAYVEQVNGGP